MQEISQLGFFMTDPTFLPHIIEQTIKIGLESEEVCMFNAQQIQILVLYKGCMLKFLIFPK